MGGPLKVLVVDDDLLFARSLSRDLTARGAEVATVHDLASARHELEVHELDLVVLDFKLKDADGPALLETWPGDKRLPPTIVLSGYVGIRETVRTMRAGALDVLKKPASAREILDRFHRALLESSTPTLPPAAAHTEELIGSHPAIESARNAIASLARSPGVHVTLVGETGTGKARVARLIHDATSPGEPFVPINCAAVPEALFEEELWGTTHPADNTRAPIPGLLNQAGQGTLFLDEVIAVPELLQPKLLELVRTRQYVSGNRCCQLEARIISAIEPDLSELTGSGGTLSQLLTSNTISLPPLRERSSDIEALANYFLEQFAARHPGAPRRLTRSAVATLLKHQWPGNLRELQGVVHHSAAVCQSPELGSNIVQSVLMNRTGPAHAASGMRKALSFRGSLPELERVSILQAFRASGNNVSEAARLVGLPRSTVRDKLKRYGIR